MDLILICDTQDFETRKLTTSKEKLHVHPERKPSVFSGPQASGMAPPPYGISFIDNAHQKLSMPASPDGVVQRIVNVKTQNGVEVFDGEDSIKPDDAALQQALELYTVHDEGRIISALKDMAGEFEDFPTDRPAYNNWTEAVQAAIQFKKLIVQPLTSKTGDVLADPEAAAPEQKEDINKSPDKTPGTSEYWAAKLRSSARNKQNQVVIAGHGYRKPWETKKIKVPEGTQLHFYVFDTQALPEQGSNLVEEIGSETKGIKEWKSHLESTNSGVSEDNKFDYAAGESVYDYTVTPSKSTDTVKGTPVTVSERTKLSSILIPGMGSVHLAICREIDWWAGFREMPGQVHKMPADWKYVRQKDYEGYFGPNGEKAPKGYGSGMMIPFNFDKTPLEEKK